jgi:putative transposase
MPEHLHLLIWPTMEEYDVSAMFGAIKQSVAKRALIYVRRNTPGFLSRMEDRQPTGKVHYRFWQRGGGYDRNVVEPNIVYDQIDYIHNNPVRRGLCENPEDWFWSSAADHLELRKGPLRLDLESLAQFASS